MANECAQVEANAIIEGLNARSIVEGLNATVAAICLPEIENWTTVESEIWTTVEGENWETVR